MFYNPASVARVAIIDEDRILLVKVDIDNRDLWATPDWMIELGEDPAIAETRELEEGTGLTVDSDNLRSFDAIKSSQ